MMDFKFFLEKINDFFTVKCTLIYQLENRACMKINKK